MLGFAFSAFFAVNSIALSRITRQEEGEETARQRLADIKALPIRWTHSDAALCSEAAKLKAIHKISFADSFVAATAKRFGASLVHKDPEFSALKDVIKLHPLPPKTVDGT